jgi:hypothetical protein
LQVLPEKRAIRIFISYAQEDQKMKDKLLEHMAMLKRRGINISDDSSVASHGEWRWQLSELSEIILLLVSAAYLASDFCYSIEMEHAMERYRQGEARVIPILLSPCDWRDAPFGHLLALPKHFKPISDWANREEVFTHVIKEISQVVDEIQTSNFSKKSATRATLPSDFSKESTTSLSDLHFKSPVNIYLSYAWEDELMEQEIEAHLQMLQRQAVIHIWHPNMIRAGDDWRREIEAHLDIADIILLLVSRNYLKDDFLYTIEMGHAMERYRQGEARVIPILLSLCNWQDASFAELLALPKHEKPITSWDKSEAAFEDIRKKIGVVIDELQGFGSSGVTTMTAVPLSQLDPHSPFNVYLSYTKEDELVGQEIEAHLQPLQRQTSIIIWHPDMMSAGSSWRREVEAHLDIAHIILLLVSRNYLHDRFASEFEIKRIMERYQKGEIRVIPILISSCDWQRTPFGELCALPKHSKPISEWTDREEAFAHIIKEIDQVINELRTQHLLTAKALFTFDFDTTNQMSQAEKEEELQRIEQQLKSTFETRVTHAVNTALQISPQNKRSTIISIISLSCILILLFEMTIYYWLPFTWLTRHPASYGIQVSFDALIALGITGLLFSSLSEVRKWCWGGGAFAILLVLIQILGGPLLGK